MNTTPNIGTQDAVLIEALKVDAVIGVYDWERSITQPLVFDIMMYASQKKASETDNIDHALDYKKACELIIKTTQMCKANLIETVAEEVAKVLLSTFHVSCVDITLRKPTAIKETTSVGVKIIRHASNVSQ